MNSWRWSNGMIIGVVRKCMFKHSDFFLDSKRSKEVDVPAILESLFVYYQKFHPEQQSCTNESLKSNHHVLTILMQRLVLMERYKILNYLYLYPENSMIVHYIRRCARALNKASQGATGVADTTSLESAVNNTTMIQPTTARTIPDEMIQLFKRINDGEIFEGCVEELYNFLDVNNEQNANFEELLSTCPFGCLIQRAFVEIRQSRLRKEPLAPGECILRILPKEDRDFVEEHHALQEKLSEVTRHYDGGSSSPHESQSPAAQNAQELATARA